MWQVRQVGALGAHIAHQLPHTAALIERRMESEMSIAFLNWSGPEPRNVQQPMLAVQVNQNFLVAGLEFF